MSIRIAPGIAAGILAFSLALAPAAFAQEDSMKQDLDFKNGLSRGEAVKRDTTPASIAPARKNYVRKKDAASRLRPE